MPTKIVTIFGVFDGIHNGHKAFIKEARKHGDRLVAIVARDSVVLKLKNKLPKNNEVERINSLLKIEDVDMVYLGDGDQGTYKVLKEVNPDIIFLGYDQQSLHDNLEESIKSGLLPKIELMYGESHKPEIFHSSLLNK